jgi:hypothetical protein
MTTNSVIAFDSFMKTDGIYESTILDFYDSQIFFMGRESNHILFFYQLMDDDASCVALQQILLDLVVGLFKAYNMHVSSTTGDLDERMKSGKLMMIHFENHRCLLRSTRMSKFIHLPLVKKLFNELQNEEINRSVSEQSRLIL